MGLCWVRSTRCCKSSPELMEPRVCFRFVGETEKPQTKTHYKKEDDWSKGVKVNKESAKNEVEDSSEAGPKKERILGELQPVNEKYQKKFDEAYDFNKHQLDDSRKEKV